jgi:hypothetical protein
MPDAKPKDAAASADSLPEAEELLPDGRADELPIVARMVVEIRSDGRLTVARGAIEDRLNGEQVSVEARADSPLELSRALAKMIFSSPITALLGRRSDAAAPDVLAELPEAGVRAKVGALGRRLSGLLGRGPDRR